MLTATLLLLDMPDPASPLSWSSLMILLAIVFVLSVALVAGLAFLLIRVSRRRQASQPIEITSST